MTGNAHAEPEKRLSPRLQRTRERILQAAAEVFASQGYAGATTRGIADAAGMSELTLFRHFGTKRNLFMAMLDQYSPAAGLERILADRLTGKPRTDLMFIGRFFLKALTERHTAIVLTLCEAERIPEVREVSRDVPGRLRALLANYLRAQIELGKVRDRDPEMMAQAFLGMFFAYNISRALAGERLVMADAQVERIVAHFVEIFLEGVGMASGEYSGS